jgi:hypothetical protein
LRPMIQGAVNNVSQMVAGFLQRPCAHRKLGSVSSLHNWHPAHPISSPTPHRASPGLPAGTA